MYLFTAMFTTVALPAPTLTQAQTIVITRAGARHVRPGPTENFTGAVQTHIAIAEMLDGKSSCVNGNTSATSSTATRLHVATGGTKCERL
jgi:hypothetical protein